MNPQKEFNRLEALEEYPLGYQPAVDTQKQLVIQSVKGKSSKLKFIAIVSAVAASVAIFIYTGSGYLDSGSGYVDSGSGYQDAGRGYGGAGDGSRVSGDGGRVSGDGSRVSGSGGREPGDGSRVSGVDSTVKLEDSNAVAMIEMPAIDSQPVLYKDTTKFFAAKQRFKVFEFNRPPEAVKHPQVEKKKIEFFVFDQGNFKIIQRPNQYYHNQTYHK
jgi:hypothetical protein